MIEVYKYIHEHYDVHRPAFKPSLNNNLRGNAQKLQKLRFRLDVRGNFFANRVVDQWNGFSDSVVLAPSINAFNSRLDKHWSNLPSLYDPLCQNSR